MGNEFHIFDNFYNDLSKEQQEFIIISINNHNVNNILERVKKMGTGKNTVKKTNSIILLKRLVLMGIDFVL